MAAAGCTAIFVTLRRKFAGCHLTAHATPASKGCDKVETEAGAGAGAGAGAYHACAEGGHTRSTDEVLNSLHAQFEEWDLRQKGYRHLIAFMLFTGLYFAVLFMQRNASVVYGVNSTISTLLPTDSNGNTLTEFQDTTSLLAWVRGMLVDTYTEPDCGWSRSLTNVTVRFGFNFRTATDQSRSFWNLCAPDDCSFSSMTDPNTKCWFSTPNNFSASGLTGTQTTTLFMVDGNYSVCLLAPGGGVKGQVLTSPANVTGIAVGIATTTTVLEGDSDYVDLNVTTISDSDVDSEIATSWQYCGKAITRCEKLCARIVACFMRCPGNVTASANDIYTRCAQGMCTPLRLFPRVTVISNHEMCVLARQPILEYLSIPGANGTLEDPSDSLYGCPAAYYDRVNYPGLRPNDYCREPVVNGDPTDYCQWQNAGDSICQPSCLYPNCGNDYQVRYMACCNLVASDAHAPLSFTFSFNNYMPNDMGLSNATTTTTHSQRPMYDVGLTNRILAGILLHTTRYHIDNCSDISRFAKLLPDARCRSWEGDINPYGADPVYVRSSKFYSEAAARDPNKYYSPSDINNHGVPYGFFPMPAVKNFRPAGFPTVVAVDLDAGEAARFIDYLEDAFFIDDVQTKDLYVQFVTYNVVLQLFSNFRVTFGFNDGGSVSIKPSIVSVSVEHYNSMIECFRAALEVVLLLGIAAEVYFEGSDIYRTWVRTGSVLAHYGSFWNYIDAVSIALLFTAVITWVTFVLKYATRFDTPGFYNIYAAAETGSGRFGPHALKLDADGEGMRDFVAMLAQVNTLLCDFQPRMGLLTRTLDRAAVDLAHFFFLAILVFLCYATLALIAFGETIKDFSQLWLACVTLFQMLLGDTDVNSQLMQQNGLMYFVGVVFFWSYIILVFFILFNFLIAIVIDAFADVKADAKTSRSMGYELLFIMMDKWRACWRSYFRYNYLADRQDKLTLGEMTLTKEELAHVLFNAGVDQAPSQRAADNPQAVAEAVISRINKLQHARIASGPDPVELLETCLKRIEDQSQQIGRLQQQIFASQGTPMATGMSSMRQHSQLEHTTPYGVQLIAHDANVAAVDLSLHQVAPHQHISHADDDEHCTEDHQIGENKVE
eukprot:jgi/Chlat1/3285/Chrsp22S03531